MTDTAENPHTDGRAATGSRPHHRLTRHSDPPDTPCTHDNWMVARQTSRRQQTARPRVRCSKDVTAHPFRPRASPGRPARPSPAAGSHSMAGADSAPCSEQNFSFDALLDGYAAYVNLADDDARTALLREGAGVKLAPVETFTACPGDIKVLALMFETLIKLSRLSRWRDTTGLMRSSAMRTFSLLSPATPLGWHALLLLTRRLQMVLLSGCMVHYWRCCGRIFRPAWQRCGGMHATILFSRKASAWVGPSLFDCLTCSASLPSSQQQKCTMSRGLIPYLGRILADYGGCWERLVLIELDLAGALFYGCPERHYEGSYEVASN